MFVAGVDSTAYLFLSPLSSHLRALGATTALVVGGDEQFDVADDFDKLIRVPDFRRRGPWQLLAAERALRRAADGFRPDLLHLHTPFAILIGRRVAFASGVPSVCVVHGTPLGGISAGAAAFSAVERAQGHLSNHYIVLNREDLASYRHLAPRARIELAPCGGAGLAVPFADHPPERGSGRALRVLFLGRPAPSKRLLTLVAAWQQVRASNPDIELRIVAPPAYGDPITPVPAIPGMSVSSVFAAPLDELDAADLMAAASEREGFGMALAEALARRVPVVSTSNRGARQLAESVESGIVLTGRDPSNLAAGILRGLGTTVRLRPEAYTDWRREHVMAFHTEQIALALRP